MGVIACGALAAHVSAVSRRTGWPVDVHPLNPLLHNHPDRIAGAVRELAQRLQPGYRLPLAVAYADCGTYGALDRVCEELGLRRLTGGHCYDVFAGPDRVSQLLAEEPGTYLLTDYLVRSFARSVLVELGLDRYPHLRDDYFRHYRRVVWLAQFPTPELEASARQAAQTIGLPLQIITTTDLALQRELAALLGTDQDAGGVATAASQAHEA